MSSFNERFVTFEVENKIIPGQNGGNDFVHYANLNCGNLFALWQPKRANENGGHLGAIDILKRAEVAVTVT